MTDDSAPSFLSRWSRLKRRVALEREAAPPPESGGERPPAPPAVAEVSPASPPVGDAAPPAAPPTRTEEGKADEVDLTKLPPIESLGKDSDYSVFMRRGVPDDLRNQALRRMWLTDPSIAGPDLLEMNALDYTGLEGPRPLAPYASQALVAAAKAVTKQLVDGSGVPSGSEKLEAQAAAEPQKTEEGPQGDSGGRQRA